MQIKSPNSKKIRCCKYFFRPWSWE